jgi:hypothetical protein
MSGGKFASLTANLLVRKGDARPSTILPLAAYPAFAHRDHDSPRDEGEDSHAPRGVVLAMNGTLAEMSAAQEEPEPAATSGRARSGPPPPPDSPSDKPRRLMVILTPIEHETLGLVAVKKSLTRHQLLRNAVDEYLALLVEEYDGDCRCIQTGCACDDLKPPY